MLALGERQGAHLGQDQERHRLVQIGTGFHTGSTISKYNVNLLPGGKTSAETA